MGGNQRLTWIALFRDGHTIEQSADSSPSAFQCLADYLYGTIENPKRHYLLWFKLLNDDMEYTVSFDRDGDAYIDTPDGKCHMTEFKIRSAELVYHREHDKDTDQTTYRLGFGGINTAGKADGKAIEIDHEGNYKLLSGTTKIRDIISV